MKTNTINKEAVAERIAMMKSFNMSRKFVDNEVTFNPFVTTESPMLN